DDVRAEDRLPRPFDRVPAEMHDAVDARNGCLHLPYVGEVGAHEILARGEVRRRLDVARAQVRIDVLEQRTQPPSDFARVAGEEQILHGLSYDVPPADQRRLRPSSREDDMKRRTMLLGAATLLASAGLSPISVRAQQKLVLKATDVHPLGYPTVEAVVRM